MTTPPPGFRARTAAEIDKQSAVIDYMGHWWWPRGDRPYRMLTECPAAQDIMRSFLAGDIDYQQAQELVQARPGIDSRTAGAVRSWFYSLRTERWMPDE